ncbi:MAG: hypothetical protein MNPFHGCM_02476 [Gemmatimonadaceae bacterium]|nr:hypothetical protein [Gemmatimonadaceae bacterium]
MNDEQDSHPVRLTPLRAQHRWLRIAAPAFLFLATIAGSTGAQTTRRVVIQLPGYGTPILLDTLGLWRDVPAKASDVYRIVTGVYEALSIADRMNDPVGRYVGNTGFRKSRTLAGGPMSRLIECGSGMTGPNADLYRINLAIVTRVESLGEGKARLRSALVASGEDVSGPSRDLVACGSTGALEARIHDLVLQRLRAR